MKKISTTLLFMVLVASLAFGQQVPRQLVVLEIGTGTWCQYCPGSAMGADDLIENGFAVGVIEYHSGDEYQTTQSQSRVGYYNITGFPTAFFDGGLPVVGGSTTESMYPSYYPRVNQRMGIASSFTVTLEGTHSCLEEYTATITIDKVAAYSGTNLVLQAVLTESHIPESWFGMDEVNYVCRRMYPNQNGTAISFAGGPTQTVELQFTPDASWISENLEMVVFLQDNSSKEILQATKMSLLDFSPIYSLDAAVTSINGLPETDCSGLLEPVITLRNTGSDTLTAVDINYSVNGGTEMVYNWTGALDYLQTEEITLPGITFEVAESNELVIHSVNPNGSPDECPGNDQQTAIIEQAMFTPNTVNLLIRTDINPGETTWEVLNSAGEVLYSGGPYETSGQMINETFELSAEDCHTFNIYDAGGDGLLTPGFYLLYYGSNTSISQGTTFGSYRTVDFNTADPVGTVEIPGQQEISLYPNPADEAINVSFAGGQEGSVTISLFSLTGQKILTQEWDNPVSGRQTVSLKTNDVPAGIYFYTVQSGTKSVTGKVVVSH